MRTHFPDTLLLLLFMVAASAAHSQSSPSPVIQDYDNTSLPVTYQINSDTTFCKGHSITLHGQYFKKATSGELWDTTQVFLGGQRIWPQSITATMGGTNDRIVIQLPPAYMTDTCLRVEIVKRTILALDTFQYTVTDTICLTGDVAQVAYQGSIFCLGDPNPLPSVTLMPPTATGMFCCRTGAPGFWVNPSTGEIPLHLGAVGNNNQFLYCSNHPRCSDTVAFAVSIRPKQPAVATINGLTQVTVCQDGGLVRPDSANLFPAGAVFRSPTGLYQLNPFTGLFDPALSPVGLHELWYVPVGGGCYDSTMIQVIVLPTSTATVGYPAVPLNLGVPTLCQGTQAVWPSFTSGNSGGTFIASPSGLDLGGAGDIAPANSQTGIYTVQYATTGQCPDTVTAIANLHIDTTLSAQFTLPQTQYCAQGVLGPSAQSATGTWQVTSTTGQVLFSQGTAPIAVAATGIASGANYQLRHVTGGFCSDMASVPFSVLATDNPAFTYPPNGNFCIGDPDPWPLVQGIMGYFHAVTPLTVVDIDGRLHLSASGAGTHTIRHITGGTCKDSTDVTVNIFGNASANFAYPASVFCSGDTNPLPQILGTPGGAFSADSGLAVDSVSGAILVAQSQAGIWNVTYTLTGSCQAQFTQTVQISPTDSSTIIAYIPNHYCQSEPDAIPLVLGDTVGSFVAGGGIVFSNTDRGQLDLSAMQPGGPYIVYYDIDNRCAIDTRDSVWIDVPDNPFFSYPQSSYCEGGANPFPSIIALSGGTFSEITGSVIFANATTGEIDASASVQGGPYFIQYTTAGPCPESSSQQLTIMPKPLSASLTVSPDTTYCTGQSLILQATAGGATVWRWYMNGSLTAITDDMLMLDAQLTGLDSVSVAMVNTQGCSDSLTAVLRGLPAPRLTATILKAETNVLGSSQVEVQLATDIPGTVVDWQAIGTNLRDITPEFGSIAAFGPANPATLPIGATFVAPFDLGRLKLLLSPRNASCAGFRDTVVVILSPDTLPIFVPEVFTANGDGKNDTWMITCLPGINPGDYKMHLFNDAGGKVLEMDGLHQNFDGGSLPDGVYWWVLQDTQGRDLQAGGLTIRRK
ncbi:MAG: gliding motility-associated C-terminal domain-containing protein [Bacteroidia bacterium]|nr:gliding motility-associated C-terminal domain-containing protein [Bacteroidia bacterium]